MTHGSLFSGIGGFDLAAEWMGWENLFHCEWNEFGQTVLNHFWPNAETFTDITKSDFKKYANRIDILTGGFPCQPFSLAGKRDGTDDDRYLWPEMLRAIREIRPNWVIGENVAGILSMEDLQQEVFSKVEGRKIARTSISDHYEAIYTRNAAMLVNRICEDLEKEGYTVQPFVVPAGAIGAPHKRERIWFVAHSNSHRHMVEQRQNSEKDGIQAKRGQTVHARKFDRTDSHDDVAHADGNGCIERDGQHEVNTIETGFNAFGDIRQGVEHGIASNTNDTGREQGDQKDAGQSSKQFDGGCIQPAFANTGGGGGLQNHREGKSKHSDQNDEGRFVADADEIGRDGKQQETDRGEKQKQKGDDVRDDFTTIGGEQSFADTIGEGLQGREFVGSTGKQGQGSTEQRESGRLLRPDWEKFPTESPVCGGNDGVPDGLDGITFSKWRSESIKAFGNAICPQVAFEFFKAIEVVENAIANGEV
jgi:DNA (cytosine-5)-methyltransferase 1